MCRPCRLAASRGGHGTDRAGFGARVAHPTRSLKHRDPPAFSARSAPGFHPAGGRRAGVSQRTVQRWVTGKPGARRPPGPTQVRAIEEAVPARWQPRVRARRRAQAEAEGFVFHTRARFASGAAGPMVCTSFSAMSSSPTSRSAEPAPSCKPREGVQRGEGLARLAGIASYCSASCRSRQSHSTRPTGPWRRAAGGWGGRSLAVSATRSRCARSPGAASSSWSSPETSRGKQAAACRKTLAQGGTG